MHIPTGSDITKIKSLRTPPISSLVKKEDNGFANKAECYKFISLCLADIFTFFGTSIEPYQNVEMCKLIYGEYHFLTVAEWKLFITDAKLLKFGLVYPNVSQAKLMEWLGKFTGDVLSTAVAMSEQSHNDFSGDEKRAVFEKDKEIELRKEKDLDFAKSLRKVARFDPLPEITDKTKRSQEEQDAEFEKFKKEYKNKQKNG